MKYRSLVIKVCVPLLAVLISLVSMEIGLRVYHAAKRYGAAANSSQDPPVPLHIVTDAPYLYGLNPKHLGISAQGTRDVEVRIPKPKGTFRILVLGDSIAYGSGIPVEKTFPNRLESLLSNQSLPVEVVNAGVSGYTAYNELQYYLARGRDFEPDVVVVAFCMNDVVNPRLHWDDATDVHIPEDAIPNHDYDINHILPRMQKLKEQKSRPGDSSAKRASILEYSALYRALEPRIRRLFTKKAENEGGASTGKAPTYITGEDTISIEVLLDNSSPEWRWLTKMYDRLREATRADGATLVILMFPLAYQMDENYPFIPQKQIAEYCERNSILCLDLLPLFRRDRKENIFLLNNSGYYDIWHLTEYGHEVSAETLRRFLQENGLPSDVRKKE
jgi:hypothetical protein